MADKYFTGATELDALIPEMWSAAFYPTLLANLPFVDSVAKDYEGDIQQLGDTVHITDFPQFDEATEIGEAEAVDADSVVANGTSLIINKQVAKDFQITKKAQKQSIDAMNALRDLALYAILKKMQAVIVAEIVPSAATPDNTVSYTSGTTLALADILVAKKLLDASDVEKPGRNWITGTDQENDLFNITGFVSRDFIPAGSPLASGELSTPVLGFNVKSSTLVGSTSYAFHPIFLQMAVQQAPQVEVLSRGGEGIRATRVNMDVLFGVKQVSNKRVVTVG
jgi:hypothetical protein